jgi:hypothetical protein
MGKADEKQKATVVRCEEVSANTMVAVRSNDGASTSSKALWCPSEGTSTSGMRSAHDLHGQEADGSMRVEELSHLDGLSGEPYVSHLSM